MAISTIKDRIDRTKATHHENYIFPTSASLISDNNDKYTIQHDGICFIQYRHSTMTFSQFQCLLNGIPIVPDYINNDTLNAVNNGVFSFPVHRGDVVSVNFYQNYTMNMIKLRNLYVV